MFRATAVGLMANNVFPLRMGEFVRSWYLSRETGASAAAIFGTVILERVIDIVAIVALAYGALALWGAGEEGPIARGALWLLPVAVAPTLGLIALRAYPDPLIRRATAVLHPFSARLSEAAGGALRRFAEGLGALRGGSHLFWIAVHSLLIWLVASTLPFLAGFLSLGIDLGSPLETLEAAWLTLAAVGVAVALPSAPGFFGPYHFACKLALLRFGVPAEQAIALGTLVHAVFWVTFTVLGLVVLRLRRTSLGQIDELAEGPPGPER